MEVVRVPYVTAVDERVEPLPSNFETGSTKASILAAHQHPTLAAERLCAAKVADQIIADNQEATSSDTENIPDIDAIGSARRVVEQEQQEINQSEYQQALDYLRTDCERYTAEIMRAKTWEYFGPFYHQWDRERGILSFGVANEDIMRTGLSPDAHPEELGRRRAEYIENATHRSLAESEYADSHWCLTISMCTYDEVPGYEHTTQKMMLRGMRFERDTNGNLQPVSEQLALKGIAFDDGFMNDVLNELGVCGAGQALDRTEILSTQVLLPKNDWGGVVDFAAYMDQKLQQQSGLSSVFLGDTREQPLPYEDIPMYARIRQQQQQHMARRLEEHALLLAKDRVDAAVATARLHAYADSLAHQLCAQRPEIAADVFDEQTQQAYLEAQVLHAHQQHEHAEAKLQQAREQAPLVVACGNGSCSLKMASHHESSTAQSAGLQPLETGGYLQDGERACKNCKQKRIVYGKNGSVCTNCRTSKINGVLRINKG